MKLKRAVAVMGVLVGVLGLNFLANGQPGSQPLGRLLDAWTFDDTNWLSARGHAPMLATNIECVPSWQTNALQIDETNAAILQYPIVNADGQTNLTLTNGTLVFWFSPDSGSANTGGTGPGSWARLVEVGQATTNASFGWWSLYLNTNGNQLYFAAQNNGTNASYLVANIAWQYWSWHELVLTYSPSNSVLYVDGMFTTNGPGITIFPSGSALTNGFRIGSDVSGWNQAGGQFENFRTYDFPWPQWLVLGEYLGELLYVDTWDASMGDPRNGGGTPLGDPSSPGSGGGSGGGGALFTPGGTNLFLEIPTNGLAMPGQMAVNVHNTLSGEPYNLLTKQALTGEAWFLEQYLVGTTNTNSITPTTVPMNGRTNLFVWAVDATNSTGGAMPDWWQLEYFGYLGVDPYGDPKGDGWSNIQKYQAGLNPNLFDPPPAPQPFNAYVNSNGTTATVNWSPPPGPVQSYVLERADPSTDPYSPGLGAFSQIATINAPTNSFVDTGAFVQAAPDDGPVYGQANFTVYNSVYRIHGVYANGSSQMATAVLSGGDPALGLDVKLIRNQSGHWELVCPFVPTQVTKLRLDWFAWHEFFLFGYFLSSEDIPITNLVSGVYVIPDSDILDHLTVTNAYGEAEQGKVQQLWVQGVDSSGKPGPAANAGRVSRDAPCWTDGRRHMKQNLAFQFRAASEATVCPLLDHFWDAQIFDPYEVVLSTNFVESSIFHYAEDGNDDGEDFSFVKQDNLWPFNANYQFQYVLYDTNDVASGFQWGMNFDTIPAPPVLDLVTNPYWIHQSIAFTWLGYSPDANYFDPAYVAVSASGTNVFLGSGAHNLFGLAFQTALVNPYTIDFLTGLPIPAVTLAPGGSVPNSSVKTFYSQTAAPGLQPVGYYFAPVLGSSTDAYGDPAGTNITVENQPFPLPVNPTFNPTNQTPLLLAAVGQPIMIGGWQKLQLTNGHANQYGYLGQYYTNAYVMDAAGNVTATNAGILSPYGDFLPTRPGPAALITMPDIDPPYGRGTGVVQVISLNVDANHDGVMDLTYFGTDQTTPNHPYQFWVNNDYDRSAYDADDALYYEDSVLIGDCPYTPGQSTPDGNYRDASGKRVIPTKRDLQDYARLWVSGVTSNVLSNLPSGSTVTLSWGDVGSPNTNNPIIDLFAAADTNGGLGYLTNETTAIQQTNSTLCPYIGRLWPGTSLQLNASIFSNHWAGNYFVWCGVTSGGGALTLTIADGNGTTQAQAAAYIQIQDIKQMYERWTVGDTFTNAPTNTAYLAEDNITPGASVLPFKYSSVSDTNTPYILFVHGWNLETWDKDRFAETAYKRLYWQGYQGRFGEFRWPTGSGFIGLWSIITNLTEKDNYDSSEYNAWRSAAGLVNKLDDLNAQYPGHVYLLAHSMGNVVASDALRLSGSSQVVNTYVASQAAITAHTYDTNVPNYSFSYPPYSYSADTPNIYGNWFAGNNGGGAGHIVSFYNTNDFALARGRWQVDQLLKPDHNVLEGSTTWTYIYTGYTNDPPPWDNFSKNSSGGSVGFFITNSINNRYEVMAYAAQPYTTALGATQSITNLVTLGLTTIWPSPDPLGNNYASHFYHSAEFRSDTASQWQYWNTLLSSSQFGFDIINP